MKPFEAYSMFMAMKLHFKSDYDYVKYQGKTRLKKDNFLSRKDQVFYDKLARVKNIKYLLIANLFEKSNIWVGHLFNEDSLEKGKKLQARHESLTYRFEQDLSKFDTLNEALNVNKAGDYPLLYNMYKQGEVMPETLLILNDLYKIFDYWDKTIEDKFLWPQEKDRLLNLGSFLLYDRNKMNEKCIYLFRRK